MAEGTQTPGANEPFLASRFTRRLVFLALATLVLVGVGFAGVVIGSESLTWSEIVNAFRGRFLGSEAAMPDRVDTIVFELRLPRVLSMAVTGGALALAGAAYQGLFRNPLADPYVIGVASGAGLGATAVLAFSPSGWLLHGVPLGAFAGGVASVMLVVLLARSKGRISPLSLILSGVAVGAFLSSVTTFWMLESPDGMRRAFSWILGGYTSAGWAPIVAVLPALGVSAALLQTQAHALNVMQLGPTAAASLGVRVRLVHAVTIVAATLATAAAVSFGGLIGFVGLMVPHGARLLVGADYRWILPLSLVGGGALLVSSDLAARTVLSPREIPVALVTSLLGAPFFLILLKRSQSSDDRD